LEVDVEDFERIPTSPEVYAVIMARHREHMTCYGSFSDPDGTFNGGPGERGRMVTTWAIAGCDFPILEIRTSWDIDHEKPHKRINEKHEHWLCVGKREA
jgi:hypothetical protein